MNKEDISNLMLMHLDDGEYFIDISEAPNWILVEKVKG